jgi:aspartate/methionine/tyrosine aminotransferase
MNGMRALGRFPAMDLADRATMRGSTLIPMRGAPVVPMPEHVIEAVQAQAGDVSRRQTRGTPALRRALVDMLLQRDGVAVDPEREIIVTHGASHGLSITLGALCGPGDEVVVPVPTYFFDGAIHRTGAVPRHVPCHESRGWALDVDQVADAITERTRVILLCNPVNPTGRVHTAEEMDALTQVAMNHGVVLVSDESFSHYCYDAPFVPAASRRSRFDRIVTVQSLSKNYAFADWRIGYVHAPPDLLQAIHRCFEWDAINVGSVPQAAALAAITGPRDWIDPLIRAYPAKRDLLLEYVAAADLTAVTPGAGAAVFVDFGPLGVGERELENKLLGHGIAALAGNAFRGPAHHARLLFGGDIDELRRLGDALCDLGQAHRPDPLTRKKLHAMKGPDA